MSFILVTGATGFMGAKVIDELLQAGYRVRGTVRSPKADALRAAYESYGDKFEAAVVDDVATSDWTNAFEDVRALVHVATSIGHTDPRETVLQTAIDGTRRVLEAANAAGVQKIIVTGSVTATFDPSENTWKDVTVSETSWNPLSKENAFRPDANVILYYSVAKKIAEEEVWRFAREHPDIDVTTILPPFVYGPHSPRQVDLAAAVARSTNSLIQLIISKRRPFVELAKMLDFVFPGFIHVDDVVTAHVRALEVPPSSTPKRVIASAGDMDLRDAVEHLAKVRPQLREKLPDISGAQRREPHIHFDGSTMATVLGMQNLKTWQETLEDAVDYILRLQGEAL